jgi:DNA-binding NarL/FixJ family response regulator
MPGGNGIELLSKLKKMNPAPKVIMLTNFSYIQYRKKCEDAGCEFFFDKSSEFDKIPEALDQIRKSIQAKNVTGPICPEK